MLNSYFIVRCHWRGFIRACYLCGSPTLTIRSHSFFTSSKTRCHLYYSRVYILFFCFQLPIMRIMFVTMGLAVTASALSLQQGRVGRRATGFALQNGEDAINLKYVFTLHFNQSSTDINMRVSQKFKSLNINSPCSEGEDACINDQFAQCVEGNFVIQGCASGTM